MEHKQKPHLHATWIDRDAIGIVERLQKSGHMTYLVGGCVRDLLAGLHPKDFDIATNAQPNMVKKRVWGSYVIGRRFRLVLAKRGDQQYEIATFRRAGRPEDFVEGEDAPIGDNFFGTPEEDALRRDFTINALFYDPINDQLIDYAKGLPDIEAGIVRMIGDPKTRILEDSIRSLRAVRLSHKLRYTIESEFRAAIQETAAAVAQSALPRRREEYLKFLRLDHPLCALAEMFDLSLLQYLLPTLHALWQDPQQLETFIHYWHLGTRLQLDPKDPVDLYLPLVFAFSRACQNQSDLELQRDNFMRDELGMFKAEMSEVMHILELSQSLPNVTAFRKRGQRRQQAFLNQYRLPQAITLAEIDFQLSPEDLNFWRTGQGDRPLLNSNSKEEPQPHG